MAVVTVAIEDLRDWLNAQPNNTVDTPYELEVTNLPVRTERRPYELVEALQYFRTTKYVDLSPTTIPENSYLVLMFYKELGNAITNLVRPPKLPSSATDISGMFMNCSNLRECPIIPNSVTNMIDTFNNCIFLTKAPIIPNGVTNMSRTFYHCTELDFKPIIPSTVTSSVDCFAGVTTPNWKGTQSQVESFLTTFFAQTTDSEIQIYNDDLVTYKSSIYNISINTLSTYLVTLQTNTTSTPYKIFIRDLTTSNARNIADILSLVQRFVDLSLTVIPEGTNCVNLFYNTFVFKGLVKSPILPTDATDLIQTFSGCKNLQECPVIPNSVTDMTGTFQGCTSITTPPIIPNSVTNMNNTFASCENLTSAPVIPNGVTTLEWTFRGTAISTPPVIPNTVTNMRYTFADCSNLTVAPIIPEGVTNIGGCFKGSAIVTVPYIPSTITYGTNFPDGAFENCSNLIKIEIFKIPLNTLKNNLNFKNMFKNCTSLRSIGLNTTADDWHVFSLKVAGSNVTGKIYSRDKSSVSIPQTSITKSNIQMPVLTDELWFPPSENEMSDAEVEDAIEDLIDTKYSWYEGTTLDPNGDMFVMYAKDPSKFTSNIDFGGGGTVDTAMSDSSTNAVQNKVIKEYVDTAEANAKNLSNATGTLAVSHGGTGQTSLDNVTVGVSKNTSALDKYVTCSTGASTSAKTVTLAGFTLVKGARLIVYLQTANTAQSALTLNVNSTGAKTIRWNGTVTSSSTYAMTATYYNCYYDGTYWNMDSTYEARSARVSSSSDLATQADYTRGNAYCTTAAGTQAKVANMRGYVLAVGSFPITFTNANSYNGKITLNVNSKGAKDIWINGAVSSSSNKTLPAGTYMCFYDGSKYMIDTVYSAPSSRGVNTVSADNMQSVSSNAVYSALNNIETYTNNGLYAKKCGRVVSVVIMRTGVSGSSGSIIDTLPSAFMPTDEAVPTVFFDNSTDTPLGQALIYIDGNIRLWTSGGGSMSNIPVRANWCYIV